MSMRSTVGGMVGLTRPGNVIAASFLTFVGAFVAAGVDADPTNVVLAVVATGLATGAGNAINDYFDRDIDAINRPDRPIPSGAVTERQALWFSVGCFLGAVAAAVLLPLAAIAIAGFNLLALVVYTKLFKGLPGVGNAVVGYLTGSTFLFGGAAVGEPFGAVVLFALASIATLTREIVKDVEDIEGDETEGLRTLPIAIGRRNALYVGTGAMTLGVAASVLPYVDGTFGVVYLVAIVPADVVMLWATSRSFEDPTVGQRYLKAGMILAAVAFLLGRAAVVL
ncbi:MAG: geranylgeranylglycerol-phosphate geranylgeranyltransferase [Halobacteriota archaeon]